MTDTVAHELERKLEGQDRSMPWKYLAALGVRVTAYSTSGQMGVVSFLGSYRGVRVHGYHDHARSRFVVEAA